MKHTPGPWKQRYSPLLGAIAVVADIGGEDALVAEMAKRGDATANAKLMAASPDMLDALEGLDALPRHDIGCEHSKAVRAAIEAAT